MRRSDVYRVCVVGLAAAVYFVAITRGTGTAQEPQRPVSEIVRELEALVDELKTVVVPPLVLTCPDDQALTSPDGNPVEAVFPSPTATGGAPPVEISTAPSGAWPVAVTRVTVTARSADGQTQECGYTVTVTYTPTERIVRTADELRAALPDGGEIRMEPGTYDGNFAISKAGTRLRGVRDLPPARVTPEAVAAVTLVPINRYNPTLTVTASDVVVEGMTVRLGATDRTTVIVGTHDATTVDAQPKGVTFDRVAILAGDAGGLRGIALHGSDLTVTRSHIAGFWYKGRDSQAVWINNGPGPYTLTDNYLEGSGENVLVGGAEIYIPDVVPSDIVIAGNTIYKPEAWRAYTGAVKNSVEFKAVRRGTVEGNLIEGNWKDAQAGDTIVLTPRNPSGRNPWIVVEDVTITRNIVRRARDGYVVSILGNDNNNPTKQTANVTVAYNLFENAAAGVKVVRGMAGTLTIRRNTWPAITDKWLLLDARYGVKPDTLTATGNVTRTGAWGVVGDGSTAIGLPSLLAGAVEVVVTGNVIEQNAGTRNSTIKWPAGNTLLPAGMLADVLDPATFKHPDAAMGY